MTDPTFVSVAPILPVRDLDAALDRYRRMGFAVRAYAGPQRYGFVDRDGVSLHLSEEAGHGHHPLSVYLYVSDADAVHAAWAEVEGFRSEVEDTPWGMREFSFVDPDNIVHRVGHHLPR